MTISIDQFTSDVLEFGLLTTEELSGIRHQVDKSESENPAELADRLIADGKLTAYQGDQVLAGEAASLVIDEYTVLDQIGKGGMGSVLKAQHRLMKRVVAIKLLAPQLLSDQESVQRFYREVQAIAKFSHPQIVTAHDARKHGEQHCLVMEYVQGSDLAAVVNRDGPLPVPLAVSCVIQAAEGLQYAHAKGVIHRDVKPSNLLLGNDGRIKLLDLGLAQLNDVSASTSDETAASPLTQPGQLMGTIDYMSPEQAEDTSTADERCDIYSLGCTLHFLLTGVAPYSDESSTVKKLLAHREAELPALSQGRSDVPAELEAVFKRMVAKTAGDRQASMGQVIDELTPFAGDSIEGLRSLAPMPGMGTAPTVQLTQKAKTALRSRQVTTRDGVSPALGDVVDRKPLIGYPIWVVAGVLALAVILIPVIYSATRHETTDSSNETPLDSRADLIDRLEASVVRVNYWGDSLSGHGSGFVLDADGIIVTNYHVIEHAAYAEVVFKDGTTLEVQGLLGIDRHADLALLKVNPPGTPLDPLTLSDKSPRKGDAVLAFGSPQGLDFTATEGIVSAVRSAEELDEFLHSRSREEGSDGETSFVQTTAPISSGNSGGPLVNTDGDVVGVNTWILVSGQNLNFAVSSGEVSKLFKRRSTEPQTLADYVTSQQQTIVSRPRVEAPELPAQLSGKMDPGLLHTFTHHTGAVRDIAVSPDGRFLATASADKSCWIIELSTLELDSKLESSISSFECVCFSLDGEKVFTGQGPGEPEDRNIWVWDRQSAQLETRIIGRDIGSLTISVSDDGKSMVTTHRTGLVDLRPMNKPGNSTYLGAHDRLYPCWDAAFSPNGLSVVTAGGDGMLFVWTTSPAPLSRMIAHEMAVRTVAFSPSAEYVLSGSSDRTLKLWSDWNIQDHWQTIQTYTGHDDQVTCCAFSAEGDRFVSGGLDHKVIVWDVVTGKPIHEFAGHEDAITSVVYFPSGRFVASSSLDQTVKIWNVPDAVD